MLVVTVLVFVCELAVNIVAAIVMLFLDFLGVCRPPEPQQSEDWEWPNTEPWLAWCYDPDTGHWFEYEPNTRGS